MPLDKSLAAKQARMQEALAAYGKAADYGIAEVTTAANYEIAELYHALSKDLYASERPPELTTDELEQYDILLEEQAFPFEEEAIELHETNAARTADGIYDEWVRKSLARSSSSCRDVTRRPKSERPLSKPFANFAAWPLRLRSLAAGALALTLAACGSSAPRQADVERAARRSWRRPAASARARCRCEQSSTCASPSAVANAAVTRDEAELPRRRGRASRCRRPPRRLSNARSLRCVPRAGSRPSSSSSSSRSSTRQYPGPHVNLALVYLHDARRDDARDALERALSVEPGHAAANTQLGILLREDGKFAEAEQAYRRALATDPEYALAHYNLGVLLDIYLRRTAEALEQYELYQASLTEPNETVGRWIIDLRRRVGNGEAARVAQEDGR